MNPEQLLTPEILKALELYLVARAHHELKQEQVDEIKRQLLSERVLMATLCTQGDLVNPIHPGWTEKPERITDPKDTFRCQDETAVAEFFAECHRRERADGIKPDGMPETHCPALVAHTLLTQAERHLIDTSGAPFGVTADRLYGDNWEKWIDLVSRIIINHPSMSDKFTAPQLLAPFKTAA